MAAAQHGITESVTATVGFERQADFTPADSPELAAFDIFQVDEAVAAGDGTVPVAVAVQGMPPPHWSIETSR